MRVVVAISGKGRSLENLIREQANSHYNIVGVISSSPSAEGNKIASAHKLPLLVLNFNETDPTTLQSELLSWLRGLDAQLIALAGFLKKFPVLDDFENTTLNIHPALLPKYGGKGMYGKRIHEQVFHNQEQNSGASVHFVNEAYDEGALIAQASVAIGNLNVDQIAEKVFDLEKKLYPYVLELFSLNKLEKTKLPLLLTFDEKGQLYESATKR